MTLIPAREEEVQLLRYLDALDGECEASKREIAQTWEENIRQARGDQWRVRRSPYFLANIIRNEIRRKVGALTESKPEFQIRANKPGLDKASRILYSVAKAIFHRDMVDDALYRVGQFGMTVGCGFMAVTYDPLKDDIELSFIDPRRVYIDPAVAAAADLNKAQYLRIDTVLPLAEIRMRFIGRGSLVKPSEKYSAYPTGATQTRTSMIGSVLASMPQPYRPGMSPKQGPIPRAEIREYWIRDPHINDKGEMMFPGGRRVVRAGNIILVDEANPYLDGEWPIEMFEWDPDYNSPWGLDEVQDIRRLQEAINRIGDSWVRNVLLGSNFRVIADVDALDSDQWDKLDNEAGLIIRKKPNRQLEYVPPVPPDPATPGIIEGLVKLCDMLTGNLDPGGGKSMAQSSSTMEGLQQNKQTLLRASARRMESFIERLGQKLISRTFQYYHDDRILFMQGPSREWISYTFYRQQLLSDDDGAPRPAADIAKMYRDFKFLVTPGSSLAASRLQRVMTLLQLRGATGIVPSLNRILSEADIGDPTVLIEEALEEAKRLPPPPPAKGRGGRS